MKAKKLKLSDLEISSFVTAIEKDVKAGAQALQPGQELDPVEESGWHTCKSHLYTECCTFPGC
ncbi:pinensin family lanthipeptide [Roseivirga sp. BDSF3-8]|uniref:pinensin family lanthipeptide n=1 Tax=Roseivirga sp. BDSF3-8 TaxID=3241598 RepID=UPI0035323470